MAPHLIMLPQITLIYDQKLKYEKNPPFSFLPWSQEIVDIFLSVYGG